MAQSILSAAHFQDETAAFAYVEAKLWPDGPTCPFCGATEEHVGRLNGKTTRPGLRKCYACGKPFTVRMGTIFESSHLKLHLWLQAIHLMCASKKGIATRQIQRMLQCSMKTAWFLTHRIRAAMDDGALGPLGGEGMFLEADTTYMGGKEKNKHRNKRKAGNIGGEGKQSGTAASFASRPDAASIRMSALPATPWLALRTSASNKARASKFVASMQ
ncbi:MAG: hypothetical protein QOF03_1474 [Alphaproteobacteria bacterium]|nr:hypothetical protein [Alphaproteobacteria bacterium]